MRSLVKHARVISLCLRMKHMDTLKHIDTDTLTCETCAAKLAYGTYLSCHAMLAYETRGYVLHSGSAAASGRVALQ